MQVAPVFAIHGLPETPHSGDLFAEGSPGMATTRQELNALFAVIGTPAWKCIDAVQQPMWKKYLKNIPGRYAVCCMRPES